jgi:hypothetical protein
MPASMMNELMGRFREIIPVANCGANRVSVAAAVKVKAPSAPIMKPSNDSRVGGRVRRTTTAGTTYHNTYAWFMTLSGGKVIDGTAFYDSIAFNELWDRVTP